MTATVDAPEAELGRARLRKEDAKLITGQTNWTDNIKLPGMLHLAFVRSPYAHARITGVDVSGALGQPGVIAAFSGADFAEEQGSLPCAWIPPFATAARSEGRSRPPTRRVICPLSRWLLRSRSLHRDRKGNATSRHRTSSSTTSHRHSSPGRY